MYNGIGLSTVRGSGTNGYVQRNLSHIRPSKDKINYKTEEDIQKAEAQISRGPNQGILDHERKRKLEVKCLELEDVLRDQGLDDDEVTEKVHTYRQMLLGNWKVNPLKYKPLESIVRVTQQISFLLSVDITLE